MLGARVLAVRMRVRVRVRVGVWVLIESTGLMCLMWTLMTRRQMGCLRVPRVATRTRTEIAIDCLDFLFSRSSLYCRSRFFKETTAPHLSLLLRVCVPLTVTSVNNMTSWGDKVATVSQLTYSCPRENNAHIGNHLHCPSCCTCAAHAIRTSLKKSKQGQAATRRLLSRPTRAPEAAAAAQAECRWQLILILGAAPRVAAPPSARQQQPHRQLHPRRRRSPCQTPACSGSPKRMRVGIITTPLQHRAALSAAGHAAQEAAGCRGEGGSDRGAGSHRKPRGGGRG